MTIEKLIKYCLQYLELDTETDVMTASMTDLSGNDTFVEYINNIENALFMGLTRYSTANVLPVRMKRLEGGGFVEFIETRFLPIKNSDGTFVYETTGEISKRAVSKPLAHKIKEIFAINEKDILISNIEYYLIGNNIRIKKYNPNYEYYVVYYPAIHDLSFYLEKPDDNIYDIELDDLGITDEMAINLKYFVYSDLKLEENPNLATANKNVFETYLSGLQRNQVVFNQTEMLNRTNLDYESDVTSELSTEWRDIYGD